MPKIRFLLLVSCLSLLPLGARAQNVNFNYLATQLSVTVTPANSFINPSQLTQASGRQSCWIQYRPVTAQPTANSLGFVFFGPTAPAATTQAFALTPFQIMDCESAEEVDGDAVWITSTTTNDTFTIKVK